MEVTLNLAALGQILSIVVAIGAIAAYVHQRRVNLQQDGQKVEKMSALSAKVEAQEKELEDLKKKIHSTDVDLGKINGKIDTLTDMIKEIKERIDLIAPPTVRDTGK